MARGKSKYVKVSLDTLSSWNDIYKVIYDVMDHMTAEDSQKEFYLGELGGMRKCMSGLGFVFASNGDLINIPVVLDEM